MKRIWRPDSFRTKWHLYVTALIIGSLILYLAWSDRNFVGIFAGVFFITVAGLAFSRDLDNRHLK